jgi:hypothetical protein
VSSQTPVDLDAQLNVFGAPVATIGPGGEGQRAADAGCLSKFIRCGVGRKKGPSAARPKGSRRTAPRAADAARLPVTRITILYPILDVRGWQAYNKAIASLRVVHSCEGTWYASPKLAVWPCFRSPFQDLFQETAVSGCRERVRGSAGSQRLETQLLFSSN